MTNDEQNEKERMKGRKKIQRIIEFSQQRFNLIANIEKFMR